MIMAADESKNELELIVRDFQYVNNREISILAMRNIQRKPMANAEALTRQDLRPSLLANGI